jgi:hypothetical protein
MPDRRIRIDYTNWRGERKWRVIEPESLWFGATPHHPEHQWFLSAKDVEKGVVRDFAVLDIHETRRDTMTELDLKALRAQIEDGVPWRDGVLTYQQALTLIEEVERLGSNLREAKAAINRLKGMLS